MHEIGNLVDAEVILYWVRSFGSPTYGKPQCVESEHAPYGWEFVGSGSFRSVWLSPDGVAYKVEHSRGGGYQSDEEATLLKLAWEKKAPERCRLPKFSRYVVDDDETVIAIEYVRGVVLDDYRGDDANELWGVVWQCEKIYRLADLHGENVMVDEDGWLVPVDFGG